MHPSWRYAIFVDIELGDVEKCHVNDALDLALYSPRRLIRSARKEKIN